MGTEIRRDRFSDRELRSFSERLERCLDALGRLLSRPGFGRGPATVGAELEVFLTDRTGRPAPLNREVLAATDDPRLTHELIRYNLECNLVPTGLSGTPFTAMQREIESALASAGRAAEGCGVSVVPIGILPTLRPGDFGPAAMTDSPRYRALSAALRTRRREPFQIRIDGTECAAIASPDLTLEGANTSFQVHLRVDPDRFDAVYDGAQIATAPALAVSGNSPVFLGLRLWDETRVALFKQAVDDRAGPPGRREGRPRVTYGEGWSAGGPLGFFTHVVRDHPVVLPEMGDEDPVAVVEAGGVPVLAELRLHNGTVWHWNRGVYDPAGGGHLRIEMRALPAGPTPVDMAANAAFLLGLALHVAADVGRWTAALPFAHARTNFYRAARHGLAALLRWPGRAGGALEQVPARRLLPALVDAADRGLADAGVDREERRSFLAVIRRRAESGRTGAWWQRRVVETLEPTLGRDGAAAEMLRRYRDRAAGGAPVHTWPVEGRG